MRKIFTLISIILCICIFFTSCIEEEGTDISVTPTEVCVLLGKTANVKSPDLEMFEHAFRDAAYNEGECSIILLDSTINKIDINYTFPEIKSKMEGNKDIKATQNIAKLKEKIDNVVPDSGEIDIIKGLNLAKETFTLQDSSKTLIIYSAGLSTYGILNFAERPDLIYKDPVEIVEKLQEEYALPDLRGINVVWYGLGNVEDPQKELSYKEKNKLKTIWSAILEACGVAVTEKTFDERPSSSGQEEEKRSYPSVSIVDLINCDSDIWVLDEKTIGFKAESAEFVDKDNTIEKLKPYANLMRGCNKKFYIIGSTATHGSPTKCISLSEKRAEALKNVLVELNVPIDTMTVFGIGQEQLGGKDKWRENDIDSKGNLIEEVAKKNRKVMIIDADSKKGIEFINDWNEYQSSK